MSRELQLLTIHTVIPRIDSRGQLSRPSCMSPGAFTTFWGCELEGLARVNNAHSLRTCLTHPRIPLLTEDSECDFRLWGACPQRDRGTLAFSSLFFLFWLWCKGLPSLCVPGKGNRLFLSKKLRPQSSSMVAFPPVLQGMPLYRF